MTEWTPAERRRLRAALLRWYRRVKRDLPWRRLRDPYAIWLSEIMLQQTRVETVIPYFERFLAEFPNVTTLAAAPLDAVLKRWEGLGYYSRARNLHRAAQRVVSDFGGEIPRHAEDLGRLPGIGPYTRGAIASIAFGLPHAALDGNIKRVLSRLLNFAEPIDTAAGVARLWRAAAELVNPRQAGDHNQSLMELGATVCLPVNPRCATCPLRADCRAAAAGTARGLPVKSPRARVPTVHAACVAVWRGRRVLLLQRPPTGLLGGLWTLPGSEFESAADAQRVAAALRAEFGLAVDELRKLGRIDHVFTHRRLRLDVYAGVTIGGRLKRGRHTRSAWALPAAWRRYAFASVDQKALALVAATTTQRVVS